MISFRMYAAVFFHKNDDYFSYSEEFKYIMTKLNNLSKISNQKHKQI